MLRHLSTVRIQIIPYTPGIATPRNRTLAARRALPDDLPE